MLGILFAIAFLASVFILVGMCMLYVLRDPRVSKWVIAWYIAFGTTLVLGFLAW